MFNLFSMFKSKDTFSFNPDEREERMKRLEEKRKKCIAEMGDKYILAPVNKVTKLDKPRSF